MFNESGGTDGDKQWPAEIVQLKVDYYNKRNLRLLSTALVTGSGTIEA